MSSSVNTKIARFRKSLGDSQPKPTNQTEGKQRPSQLKLNAPAHDRLSSIGKVAKTQASASKAQPGRAKSGAIRPREIQRAAEVAREQKEDFDVARDDDIPGTKNARASVKAGESHKEYELATTSKLSATKRKTAMRLQHEEEAALDAVAAITETARKAPKPKRPSLLQRMAGVDQRSSRTKQVAAAAQPQPEARKGLEQRSKAGRPRAFGMFGASAVSKPARPVKTYSRRETQARRKVEMRVDDQRIEPETDDPDQPQQRRQHMKLIPTPKKQPQEARPVKRDAANIAEKTMPLEDKPTSSRVSSTVLPYFTAARRDLHEWLHLFHSRSTAHNDVTRRNLSAWEQDIIDSSATSLLAAEHGRVLALDIQEMTDTVVERVVQLERSTLSELTSTSPLKNRENIVRVGHDPAIGTIWDFGMLLVPQLPTPLALHSRTVSRYETKSPFSDFVHAEP